MYVDCIVDINAVLVKLWQISQKVAEVQFILRHGVHIHEKA